MKSGSSTSSRAGTILNYFTKYFNLVSDYSKIGIVVNPVTKPAS